jgi:hypothetical protein
MGMATLAALGLGGMVLMNMFASEGGGGREINWQEFKYQLLEQGLVPFPHPSPHFAVEPSPWSTGSTGSTACDLESTSAPTHPLLCAVRGDMRCAPPSAEPYGIMTSGGAPGGGEQHPLPSLPQAVCIAGRTSRGSGRSTCAGWRAGAELLLLHGGERREPGAEARGPKWIVLTRREPLEPRVGTVAQ